MQEATDKKVSGTLCQKITSKRTIDFAFAAISQVYDTKRQNYGFTTFLNMDSH